MTDFKEYIKISSGKHPRLLKGQFRSVSFMNDGFHVVYIPSLNLSSYGKNQKESHDMMKVALNDAMAAFNKLSPVDLFKELKSLGWERDMMFKTELSNKCHVDNKGILREFELSEDTQLQESLVTV